ncbi:hypothetical protein [Mesorhizobium sp. Cs1321R2N1]
METVDGVLYLNPGSAGHDGSSCPSPLRRSTLLGAAYSPRCGAW